ncbi:MAG TPA: SHOCT domain-containing protein [Opitutaceae bacterium]|nr:SHOCT domain-containing protein [Opitutaceae bacterium]
MQKTSPFLRALLIASLLLTLSGCVAAIGNQPPSASSATLGQQLIDLKKAKDEGVITEAEYARKRAQFIERK